MPYGANYAGSFADAGHVWNPVRKSYRWTTAVTGQVVWAPATGQRIIITDYLASFTIAGVMTVFEESNTLANLIAELDGVANGGASMPHLRTPIKTTGGGRVLITTTGGQGVFTCYGYEEADS